MTPWDVCNVRQNRMIMLELSLFHMSAIIYSVTRYFDILISLYSAIFRLYEDCTMMTKFRVPWIFGPKLNSYHNKFAENRFLVKNWSDMVRTEVVYILSTTVVQIGNLYIQIKGLLFLELRNRVETLQSYPTGLQIYIGIFGPNLQPECQNFIQEQEI